MKTSDKVTVNGEPLDRFISDQLGQEAREVRNSENRVRLYRRRNGKHLTNHSHSRHGGVRVIYVAGQRETHVIVLGISFEWAKKAPYTSSGYSILGGLEYNESSDELKCHQCGEWFRKLGPHIVRTHGMTRAEYNVEHGLRTTTNLTGLRIHSQLSAIAKERRLVGGLRPPVLGFSRTGKRAHPAAVALKRSHQGKGYSFSPERSNLRGACIAQVEDRLRVLAQSLGKTPSHADLIAARIYPQSLTRLFQMPHASIMKRLGFKPNTTGGQTGNRNAATA